MKVIFVIPGRHKWAGMVYSVGPHLGIAYLAAILKENNIEVKIVDMRLGYTCNDLLRFVDQFSPTLVGVTGCSYGYKHSYEVVDAIKSQGGPLTVLGGPHVSAIRGKVLSETKADFAIKGEGEYSLLELCKCIEEQGTDYGKIRGLLWKDGDKIIENKDRSYLQPQELDSLPLPAYEKFELDKYTEKRIQVITSRGCPYGCIFCSVRLSMGKIFRPRNPENVINEIEYWYKKGWNEFEINDDCFNLDMDRAKKICDLIIERGLKIKYSCMNGLRVDRVDRELLEKMQKSGCDSISYGVESGNVEVMRAIKKGITLEQVERAVELTNEIGIRNSGTFIIGHPSETLEKAMDTIKLAKKLPLCFTSFCNLVPYPGTELYEWVKENANLLYPPEVYLNYVSYRETKPIFETKEFPAGDRVRAIRLGFATQWKTTVQLKRGRVLSFIAYHIARFDTLHRLFGEIFKTKIGRKVFDRLIR